MTVNVTVQEFSYNMAVNGIFLFEKAVPLDLCSRIRSDAFEHYNRIRPHQIAAGLGEISEWGVHHACGRKDGFHDFLEGDFLHEYVTAYFDMKPYILSAIGAPINPPVKAGGKYEHGNKWHRDVRTYVGQGNRQLLVMLLMLDDFTVENGATEILFGTHHSPGFPPADFIEKNKRTICAPAGSIVLMDGDVWHRAGENRSENFRLGVSCVLTRPYFKQQLDYPRYFDKEYAEGLSPRMRQLFGFNARVPSTIEEWYQPTEKRFYKSDQG